MKKIELTKKGLFRFMDMLGLTPDDLASIREWLTEYSARKADTLPCMVDYVGYDPDGEQNGLPTVSTVHYSKLSGGDPVIAHLGVKLLVYPIFGHPTRATVDDLKGEANKLWINSHPLTQADWNLFSTHQKSYMDLNKILKGLPRPVDLPDIRDHIYYLHDTTPECTVCTRLDVKTGQTEIVNISEIDYILCVVD